MEARQRTDEAARSSGAPPTRRENFPFHLMVRESENNMDHLSSRGSPGDLVTNVMEQLNTQIQIFLSREFGEGLDAMPQHTLTL